ncbi:LADA_0C11056g1_1 [Lachancea dasiensis]|uniref:LADA_0C11056g1_1 n=1 Tax=Lachancea dasiensis TaxID=1072105 RepID=A0A1G4J1F8_9SACH|nr:LADA_0C11056g1_1 [Lachancea dasiensis]
MAVQKVIRKKSKAKADPLARQKAIWMVGHGLTLGLGAIYGLFYLYQCLTFYRYRSWKTLFLISRPTQNKPKTWLKWLWRLCPQIAYRLSLIGALAAHSVTSYQTWLNLNPTWYDLLSQENFQGILIAALWLFSRASIFKILPFMLSSFLHLTVKDAKKDEKDTKSAEDADEEKTKSSKSADRTTSLLHVIAYSELVVVVTLIFDTVTFRDGVAGFLLVMYLSIYWLRLNFSPYAQETLLRLVMKVDQKVPPKYQPQWKELKQFLYLRMDDSRKRQAEVANK